LNKEEEVYSDIIRSLTEKKRTQIKIDVNFKDSLKKELLSEYSLLYEKSRAVNGFLDIWKFSFLRFAVSYSMFFVLTFTFYN
jgi:predicted CopG family antitoxin